MHAVAPVLSILVAATLFGTTGTALAKGPPGIDPMSAGSLRLLVGGGGLCAIAGTGLISTLRSARVVIAGSCAVAVYQIGFFWGTQRTGVALATIVTIGSSPLVARAISIVRHRPTRDNWWLASALVLLTGLLLLVIGSAETVAFDVFGVLAALAAGTAYAVYTECGAELMSRGVHPTAALAALFLTAGVMTTPLLVVRDVAWLASTSGLVVIVYLALVTLSFAYVWFGWGLKRLPPSTVVMLTMVEPVVASILAVSLLHEHLPLVSWAGVGVVIVGLVIVGVRSTISRPDTVGS